MQPFFYLLLAFFCKNPEPVVDKAAARQAYTYLNNIRIAPGAYAAGFPFLREVPPRKELHWNDTLAQVAEAKALDMARRQYFGHIDPDGFGLNKFINQAGYRLPQAWLVDPKANYFESLCAGSSSCEEAIGILIKDEGVPSLGHRNHLLGLTAFHEAQVDIGIGYVRVSGASAYSSYTCVVIARHTR
jgi:uncharacterized protein YkwD